jgi:hypothetical protein
MFNQHSVSVTVVPTRLPLSMLLHQMLLSAALTRLPSLVLVAVVQAHILLMVSCNWVVYRCGCNYSLYCKCRCCHSICKPSANNTYTLTVTDANSCTGTTTRVVTVAAPPTLTAIASPANVVCRGNVCTYSNCQCSSKCIQRIISRLPMALILK